MSYRIQSWHVLVSYGLAFVLLAGFGVFILSTIDEEDPPTTTSAAIYATEPIPGLRLSDHTIVELAAQPCRTSLEHDDLLLTLRFFTRSGEETCLDLLRWRISTPPPPPPPEQEPQR